MTAAVLFSGGKDSVYATYIAQQQHFDIRKTLTIVPARSDSYMFHVPNARLAPAISNAMGLSNVMCEVPDDEDELKVLSDAIGSLGVDAIITGALASDFQTLRINMVCEPLGMKVFSPLWHKNQEMMLREIVNAGFKVVIVGTFAEGFDEKWIGKLIEINTIDDLVTLSKKKGIQISGEGGEFETIVLDGPNFLKSLSMASCKILWKKDSGILRIDALRFHQKKHSQCL